MVLGVLNTPESVPGKQRAEVCSKGEDGSTPVHLGGGECLANAGLVSTGMGPFSSRHGQSHDLLRCAGADGGMKGLLQSDPCSHEPEAWGHGDRTPNGQVT